MARLTSSVLPTLKSIILIVVILFLYITMITSRLAGNDNNNDEVDADSMTARQVTDYFLMTNRSSSRLVHRFGGKMERNQNHFTQSGIDG